jgi:SAM-dependent methyltransferase
MPATEAAVTENMRRRPYYENVFTTHSDAEWDAAPGKDVIVAALDSARRTRQLGDDERVVDIGSGTGFLLSRIHAEVCRSWTLTGIDFSETALDRGRRSYPDLTLIRGDGATTEFTDAQFSVVVSYGSIEHFDSPERGILEVGRILQPGGRFFIMVPSLGYYREDRDDEGWYDDLTGQPQWNLTRPTWESYFSAAKLELGPPDAPRECGALKPQNFFFGVRQAS